MVTIHKFSPKDFSTIRESSFINKHIIPIDKRITIKDVTEDLINISDLHSPSYNFLKNPLFAYDTVNPNTVHNWNTYGMTLSLVTSVNTVNGLNVTPFYSNSSVRMIQNRDGLTSGIYQDIVNPNPGLYYFQAYFAGHLATNLSNIYAYGIMITNGNNILLPDSNYELSNRFNSKLSSSSLLTEANFRGTSTTNNFNDTRSSSWRRLSILHTIPRNTEKTRIHLGIFGESLYTDTSQTSNISAVSNLPLYIDAVQMETDWNVVDGSVDSDDILLQEATLTDIIDPYEDRYFRYLGSEFDSDTVREEPMKGIRYVKLLAKEGNVYIDFDRNTYQNRGNRGILLEEGDVFEHEILIDEKISFVNQAGYDTARVTGYVMGF